MDSDTAQLVDGVTMAGDEVSEAIPHFVQPPLQRAQLLLELQAARTAAPRREGEGDAARMSLPSESLGANCGSALPQGDAAGYRGASDGGDKQEDHGCRLGPAAVRRLAATEDGIGVGPPRSTLWIERRPGRRRRERRGWEGVRRDFAIKGSLVDYFGATPLGQIVGRVRRGRRRAEPADSPEAAVDQGPSPDSEAA